MSNWIEHRRLWLLLGLSLVNVGCSTLESPQDGYTQGYNDGLKGQSYQAYEGLSSSAIIDYQQGYLKGIMAYCNPNHAYQIGLSGSYYEGVCEGTPQAQQFRMEWQRGWNER